MKILFLQDNGFNEYLGITYISAVLKNAGHDTWLLIKDEEKNFFAKVVDYKPDLIAFSCTTGIHKWALATAKEIKESLKTPIIFGGPHPTLFPEIIKEDPVDIVCVGEGEYPMLDLVTNMKENKDITKIPNLWIKKNGKIYRNNVRPLVGNLDELPLPDRAIYYDYDFIRNISVKRFISGRGCPFNCSFCHNPYLREIYHGKGTYVRKMSIERTLLEIEDVKFKYPLKTIHFSDDTFDVSKKWLLEFLPEYKKRIGLPFTCNVRIDLIDKEVAKALADAYCIGAVFGLETGNERIRFDVLRKAIPDEIIRKNIIFLKNYGIKVMTTNMIGIPGETVEMAFKTAEFNRELGIDYIRVNIMQYFPKTEFIKLAREKGYISEDFNENIYADPQQMLISKKDQGRFTNLRHLFWFLVRFPVLESVIRFLIKLPPNPLFALLHKLRMFDELFFYKITFRSAIPYYFKTFWSIRSG